MNINFRMTYASDYIASNDVALRVQLAGRSFEMAVDRSGALGVLYHDGGETDFFALRDPDGKLVFHDTGGLLIDASSIDRDSSLFGGSFGDHLLGGAGNDGIAGNAGDDTINGGAGSDDLSGGGGDDTLRAGAGESDRLHGGAGADTLIGNGRGTRITGGAGDDRLVGSGDDVIDYSKEGGGSGLVVSLHDGYGHDTFRGLDTFEGIRNLTGSDFGDRLAGDGKRNTLLGEAGDDFLVGLSGNDVLKGGRGADLLRGDDGDDRFVFDVKNDGDQRDTVVDFVHDADAIVLGGLADPHWVDRRQIDAPFSGERGEIRYDDGILKVDINGDSHSDFEVKIQGHFVRSDLDFAF